MLTFLHNLCKLIEVKAQIIGDLFCITHWLVIFDDNKIQSKYFSNAATPKCPKICIRRHKINYVKIQSCSSHVTLYLTDLQVNPCRDLGGGGHNGPPPPPRNLSLLNSPGKLGLILTLPRTKNPSITHTLTLCCQRYHRRSNCRRSNCQITITRTLFLLKIPKVYCHLPLRHTTFNASVYFKTFICQSCSLQVCFHFS